jgi:hypothetical protein
MEETEDQTSGGFVVENVWDQASWHAVVKTAVTIVELGGLHAVEGVVAFEAELTHLDAPSKQV